MKTFTSVSFDLKACKAQLKKFHKLLKDRTELEESKDILPFFRANEQLAAFIGGRFPKLLKQDLIAFEYDIFGDFACDLVVGNSQTATFCFVEFEDGNLKSIFRQAGAKATPEWSPRFDHGFSQIVDWFWKLDEMRATPEYADRFGASFIEVYGLLVIGRDEGHSDRERRRMMWRMQKVLVDSHSVACITFDQLYQEMDQRLQE